MTLANIGSMDAEEVVQVYLSAPGTDYAPISSLAAFRRVPLRAGERQTLTFQIPVERMALADRNGVPYVAPGRFRLIVGGCSPGARSIALGAPDPVSVEFIVAASGED